MKYVFGSFSFQLSSLTRYLCETSNTLKLTENIAKIDRETSCFFAYNHPFPNYKDCEGG